MSSTVDPSAEPATMSETSRTSRRDRIPSKKHAMEDKMQGGAKSFSNEADRKRALEAATATQQQPGGLEPGSLVETPQPAGAARAKKARIDSANPRPHTTAPKSGVGTLQSRQPPAAKSRSKPATVPQLAPTAFGKSQGKRVTTKKTRKQVIEETMEGQQDLGVMFGGSAATAKARANPNVRMTMRGRQDAGINCETRRGGKRPISKEGCKVPGANQLEPGYFPIDSLQKMRIVHIEKQNGASRKKDSVIICGHVMCMTKNHKRQFLVRWKGYGADDDTWEYEADIVPSAVRAFDGSSMATDEQRDRDGWSVKIPKSWHPSSPGYAAASRMNVLNSIVISNHDGRKQPREKAATLRPAPSEHGDSPASDGAVGGALRDSEVILMGAPGT